MAEFLLNEGTSAEADELLAEAWKPDEPEFDTEELRKRAEENVSAIIMSDLGSTEAKEGILDPLEAFGKGAMSKSAARNKLLSSRMIDLSRGGEDAGNVGTFLSRLHQQVKDLDPSTIDLSKISKQLEDLDAGILTFFKRGFIGKLLSPVRKYFAKYEKADVAITEILASLDKGAKIVSNDIVTLQTEEKSLIELTRQLTHDAELGHLMDETLEQQLLVAEQAGGDAEKIKFAREEILFPLRQRVMDMHQMIVVNQQAIIAMSIIRRNDKELIRGVERAKNVTVTALRTGVMVASALFNQKVVIEKIQALNETTENVIMATSRMLGAQGAEIQRQATETTVSVEVLKQAFADALAAVEDVSTFRVNALPQMRQAIDDFRKMAVDGEAVVTRLEREGKSGV